MKFYFFTCMTFIVLFGGCGKGRDYEKAIADFVQTDKRGVWTDLRFKVIEMDEQADITVGDSIRILLQAFEREKASRIAMISENMESNRESLKKEKSGVMKQFYKQQIEKQQQMVDSLHSLTAVFPERYKAMNAGDVLAKEISCKFSIISPMYSARQEVSAVFILSPDGKKCYGKRKKYKPN